jgi:hypothetical protein
MNPWRSATFQASRRCSDADFCLQPRKPDDLLRGRANVLLQQALHPSTESAPTRSNCFEMFMFINLINNSVLPDCRSLHHHYSTSCTVAAASVAGTISGGYPHRFFIRRTTGLLRILRRGLRYRSDFRVQTLTALMLSRSSCGTSCHSAQKMSTHSGHGRAQQLQAVALTRQSVCPQHAAGRATARLQLHLWQWSHCSISRCGTQPHASTHCGSTIRACRW